MKVGVKTTVSDLPSRRGPRYVRSSNSSEQKEVEHSIATTRCSMQSSSLSSSIRLVENITTRYAAHYIAGLGVVLVVLQKPEQQSLRENDQSATT